MTPRSISTPQASLGAVLIRTTPGDFIAELDSAQMATLLTQKVGEMTGLKGEFATDCEFQWNAKTKELSARVSGVRIGGVH